MLPLAMPRPTAQGGALPSSVFPDLAIDFQSGSYLSGTGMEAPSAVPFSSLITVNRGSVATYFDATGTLQSATTNQARLDHDPYTEEALGLLIEPSATNLLTRSESLDDSNWAKNGAATVSANQGPAPDGTTTADLIDIGVTGSGLGPHRIAQGASVSPNTDYTASIYVQSDDAEFLNIRIFGNGGTDAIVDFDLTNNAVAASNGGQIFASVTPISSQMKRLAVTVRSGAANTYLNMRIGGPIYSMNTGTGVFAWGAQLEAGLKASSYIATASSAATRQADVVTMPSASWYSAPYGTFQIAWQSQEANAEPLILLRDASGADQGVLLAGNGATVLTGTGNTVDLNLTASTIGAPHQLCARIDGGSIAVSRDGDAAVEQSLSALPTGLDETRLGVDAALSTDQFDGWIRALSHWAEPFSNQKLAQLSNPS
ncbi:MAG: hypothetical protein KI792_11565 [Alphaproteobacteria bacterium]|nr:hypothetical protein [Alphaproteobacteria bacterium SS10]